MPRRPRTLEYTHKICLYLLSITHFRIVYVTYFDYVSLSPAPMQAMFLDESAVVEYKVGLSKETILQRPIRNCRHKM